MVSNTNRPINIWVTLSTDILERKTELTITLPFSGLRPSAKVPNYSIGKVFALHHTA